MAVYAFLYVYFAYGPLFGLPVLYLAACMSLYLGARARKDKLENKWCRQNGISRPDIPKMVTVT
jgi:hypothetical protein